MPIWSGHCPGPCLAGGPGGLLRAVPRSAVQGRAGTCTRGSGRRGVRRQPADAKQRPFWRRRGALAGGRPGAADSRREGEAVISFSSFLLLLFVARSPALLWRSLTPALALTCSGATGLPQPSSLGLGPGRTRGLALAAAPDLRCRSASRRRRHHAARPALQSPRPRAGTRPCAHGGGASGASARGIEASMLLARRLRGRYLARRQRHPFATAGPGPGPGPAQWRSHMSAGRAQTASVTRPVRWARHMRHPCVCLSSNVCHARPPLA